MVEIQELITQVHETATNKGFWDNPLQVGTHLAMVGTEVDEALDAENDKEFAEELSDIIIWLFDLCGGHGFILSAAGFDGVYFEDWESEAQGDMVINYKDRAYALSLYRYLSKALADHRKGLYSSFMNRICDIVQRTIAWGYSRLGRSILPDILAKMEKNKTRPRLHGKQY
jgi:NTP pyrophosphatase (non-canonical NTP hydrolase)